MIFLRGGNSNKPYVDNALWQAGVVEAISLNANPWTYKTEKRTGSTVNLQLLKACFWFLRLRTRFMCGYSKALSYQKTVSVLNVLSVFR